MKRIFTQTRVRLLGLLIFIVGSAQAVQAQQYTLTDNDVVVTNGVIQSCSYDFAIKDIVIPETLDGQTVVGIRDGNYSNDGVFYGKGIEKINLPSTITEIGDYAFGVNTISEIVLPENLLTIGNGSFASNHLASVIIPKFVKSIAEEAFYDNSLTNLTIPSSVEEIGNLAFNSNRLETVILESGIVSLGYGCFKSNLITSINIPSTVKKIGESAFSSNQISNISLSEGLCTIGKRAFSNNNLTTVDIPNTVTRIGEKAFSENNIENIALPVAVVDDLNFINWVDSEGNTYEGGVSVSDFDLLYTAQIEYTLKDSDVVVKNGIIEKCSYDFAATSIIIPEVLDNQTVVGIKDRSWNGGVFYNKGIIKVQLPKTLIKIGAYAFYECSLTSIDIPENVTTIGEAAFRENNINNIVLPESVTEIQDYAFYDNNLSSLNLTQNIKIIGQSAFRDNRLTNLVIPSSVSVIGDHSFSSNKLTSVTIPEGVNRIGVEAFNGNLLTDVVIPKTVTRIGENAFNYNPDITRIILPTPEIGNLKFYNWVDGAGNIYNGGDAILNFAECYTAEIEYTLCDEDVVVENGIIKSCSYDFVATSIIIPETLDGQLVVGIVDSNNRGGIFSRKGMLKVQLPNKLVKIGDGALFNNKLVNITIPASVKHIGANAFSANKLVDITIPASVKHIGANAFSGNKLSSLNLSDGISKIGNYAFAWNRLVDVNLPSTVTRIGAEAFVGNSLTGIKLPVSNNAYKWVDSDNISYNEGDVISIFYLGYSALIDYTLTDDDVVVIDGEIVSCSYDFEASCITIPDVLDEQDVIGIADGKWYKDGIFCDKGIIKITLPSTLKKIGAYALGSNQLNNILLPESLKIIGERAFGNNKLTNIEIPEGVVIIGEEAFSWNRLQAIDLPSTVTRIGESAFESNQIQSFTLKTPNIGNLVFVNWIDSEGNTYDAGVNVSNFELAYIAQSEYTLTDDDVVVTDGVIKSCSYDFVASSIIVPELLDEQTIVGIADGIDNTGIFSDKGIIKIQLPKTITRIGKFALSNNYLQDITLPTDLKSIGNSAFRGNKINSLELSNKLEVVDSLAFVDNRISNLSIKEGLTTINYGAFGANELTGVNLPVSVSFVEQYAFVENRFESFTLPECKKEGFDFKYWEDDFKNNYAGNSSVDDLSVTYKAFFDINTYTISGKVIGADGVTVSLSGDASDSKTLNDGDSYSFTVNYGQNLEVLASKEGYCFEPEKYSFTNIKENKVDNNFVAKLIAFPVAFTITNGANPIANATVSFNSSVNTSGVSQGDNYGDFTTNANGVVVIENVIAGNYKYSVSAQGYQTQTGELTVDNQKVAKAISLSKVTAIDNVLSDAIKVYPNPVASTLNIKGSELIGDVTISNVAGVVVYSTKLNATSASVDVSNLQSGVYILRVFVDKGVIVKRFVKR